MSYNKADNKLFDIDCCQLRFNVGHAVTSTCLVKPDSRRELGFYKVKSSKLTLARN